MPKEYSRLLLLSLAICLSACQYKTKTVSFYYWRTTYAPDTTETDALKTNKVHTLYVRYFDVDWPDSDAAPAPLSPIRFDTLPTGYTVVPVIFFHNRVFDRLDSTPSHALAEKILALVRQIDVPAHLNPTETQFDCDWTERSRDNYFRFIRQYHALSGLTLSSTIRLHQHPTADDLLDMVDDVRRHSNQKIRDLIFFDLDRQNLLQYDKGLFEEVLDRTE